MFLIKLLIIIVLILMLLFLLLIKPNHKRDVSAFTGKSYAHRGLHDDEVPENSMTAFRLARENGYGVELDVQMTKDGQLVVFHDGSLKRMTGVDGYLRDYTFEELQKFHLLNTSEKIPLFQDVLAVLGGTRSDENGADLVAEDGADLAVADIVCEIKGDNGNMNYEICEKTYNCLADYAGIWCMESFSPFLVRWFKKNHPEVIRGQLSSHLTVKDCSNALIRFCMSNLLVNGISKPDFIAYRHKDISQFGFRCCAHLYHPLLIAWTARGTAERESAWKHFDSIIFEKNENAHPVE